MQRLMDMDHQEALGATHRTISRFLFIGCATLIGCATTGRPFHPVEHPDPPAVDPVQVGPTGTRAAPDHDPYQHQGEATMFFTLSLDSLGLTPDQQAAVKKIRADLVASIDAQRAAEQRVFAVLADGISAGTVDQASLNAAIAAVGSASAEASTATPVALDQLHAQLPPSRREALVKKLREHWALIPDDDAADAESSRRKQLVAVGVSVAQANAILERSNTLATGTSRAADPWRIDLHLHRIDAFMADVFDAKAVSVSAATSSKTAIGEAERTALFYETVAPQLTPDQRSKLVQALRERASRKDTGRAGMLAVTSAP